MVLDLVIKQCVWSLHFKKADNNSLQVQPFPYWCLIPSVEILPCHRKVSRQVQPTSSESWMQHLTTTAGWHKERLCLTKLKGFCKAFGQPPWKLVIHWKNVSRISVTIQMMFRRYCLKHCSFILKSSNYLVYFTQSRSGKSATAVVGPPDFKVHNIFKNSCNLSAIFFWPLISETIIVVL